ncbi:MAG TPA: hypothetical protein PKY35_08610 [Candidatus Hydrogenedentes bacterium]|nr:hypothetical protein [Candidatus Hydrogenedentota bacterium]HOL77077.1 hypothetical protein [Candidatus Hydrogenedentota bacterium]
MERGFSCRASYLIVEVTTDFQNVFRRYTVSECRCGMELPQPSVLERFLLGKRVSDVMGLAFTKPVLDDVGKEDAVLTLQRLHWECVRSALELLVGAASEKENQKISAVQITQDGEETTIRAVFTAAAVEKAATNPAHCCCRRVSMPNSL